MSEHIDDDMMRSLVHELLSVGLEISPVAAVARGVGWQIEVFRNDDVIGIELINDAIGQAVEYQIEVTES